MVNFKFSLSFLSLLILVFARSFGCTCAPLDLIKDTSDLDFYDYVAQIYITEVQELNNETDQMFSNRGIVYFKTLTLFKGDSASQVLDLTRHSTCNYTLSINQEWLIFGYYKSDTLRIELCDYNQLLRKADGEVHSTYPDYLNILKSLYGINEAKPENGHIVKYYRNGNKESEKFYIDGRLEGEYKYWYSSGQLKTQSNYVGGHPNGWVLSYHKNGAIRSKSYYNKHGKSDSLTLRFFDHGQLKAISQSVNGVSSGVYRSYFDTVVQKHQIQWLLSYYFPEVDSSARPWTRIQVEREVVYDHQGRWIIQREYHRNGNIHREKYRNLVDNLETNITYFPNGNIETVGYKKDGNNYGHYQWYNKDGTLGRSWDYD